MIVLKAANLINLLLLLSLCGFFASCGSDDDDDTEPQQEQAENDQGTYQANLNPLNLILGGSSNGLGTIRIRGDEVRVNLNMKATPNITHRQHIYSGSSCPTPANDVNQDGLIDFSESLAATSSILIPLDNQLNSQLAGGRYPTANPRGNYAYFEKSSLSLMLSDLRSSDPVPGDEIGKLPPDENLNLSGKVVMIHGVAGQPTLPIACGVLVRVADPIPTPIPVPVPTPVPSPLCPLGTQFSTRFSTNLAISGTRCLGGETTEYQLPDGRTQIYTCRRGQWLVTVDNINTCTVDGICTEVEVLPIIASLRRADGSQPPQHCQYNIRPISPISSSQREILMHYRVRFYQNQGPVVVPKGI